MRDAMLGLSYSLHSSMSTCKLSLNLEAFASCKNKPTGSTPCKTWQDF
jgi:hypothetical protein